MNILFIGKKNFLGTSGAAQKMDGQIIGFKQLGHNVWYTCYKEGNIILVNNEGKEEVVLACNLNILNIYWLYERAIKIILKRYPKLFELTYIRKNACTPMHLRTLSRLKKAGIIIIEEIPTYPYDKEFLGQKDILSLLYLMIDVCFRRNYKRYVSKFATLSDDNEIFGVPTIKIDNGIDMNRIPLKKEKSPNSNEIRLITVSSMYYWHGYDRLIRGVAEYYKDDSNATREVYIDMVGTGRCEQEWKELAEELNVSKYVLFHGYKSGKDLDELFDNADIAVATLALHRNGISKGAVLKLREYCARGIPFILAGVDIGLDDGCEFSLAIPENEDAVNFNEIIYFFEELNKKGIASKDIRDYAEKKFAWRIIMQKVMNEGISGYSIE